MQRKGEGAGGGNRINVVGTMMRREEVEFYLRLHGLWGGIIGLPPPPAHLSTSKKAEGSEAFWTWAEPEPEVEPAGRGGRIKLWNRLMFLRNRAGAMKSIRHRRTGGAARRQCGVLRNSISAMAGSLSSMSEIRFRWMI